MNPKLSSLSNKGLFRSDDIPFSSNIWVLEAVQAWISCLLMRVGWEVAPNGPRSSGFWMLISQTLFVYKRPCLPLLLNVITFCN